MSVDRVLGSFAAHFGDSEGVGVYRAPGRVNLIGDHTDYNEGFVLPMTIEQAVWVGVRRREDQEVKLVSVNFDEEVAFSLDEAGRRGSDWHYYVGGVVDMLARRGNVAAGIEAVVFGDVPVGSGLSSSAALEVATLVALEGAFGFELSGVEGARLCQQVEHEYIGVKCGIMDQFASRLGREGHALFIDCRDLGYREVPVSRDSVAVVLADTRVGRSLAGSKYNERRAECQEVVEFFRAEDPGVRALRDLDEETLNSGESHLKADRYRRALHVVTENARVVEAVAALEAGDMERVGMLMNASHDSLRDLYEVSSPELDRLVEIARETDGVLGARMTGAGFGGCTVTLARHECVPALEENMRVQYRAAFGREPATYVVVNNMAAGKVYP
ncbi:MAG: galactokinase [Rhodothermales bacterium]|nr:galactokinase [Rhodothermales bacterium]